MLLSKNHFAFLCSQAGCIAQKMGLPIRLVVAVNRNDIVHRTVQKGDFSLCEVVRTTLASAMDIQVGLQGKEQMWPTVGGAGLHKGWNEGA